MVPRAAAWTRPMQRAAAAFLAVAAVLVTASGMLFVRTALRDGTPTQEWAPVLLLAVVVGFLFLLLLVGSLRGWNWVFWVDLLLLGAQIPALYGASRGLVSQATSTKAQLLRTLFGVDPSAGLLLNLLVSLVGTALFAWLLCGWLLSGPWGHQTPSAPLSPGRLGAVRKAWIEVSPRHRYLALAVALGVVVLSVMVIGFGLSGAGAASQAAPATAPAHRSHVRDWLYYWWEQNP
jgi:hypothetical protein